MKQESALEPAITRLLQHLLRSTCLDVSYTIESKFGATPELSVEFSGPDVLMLLARNGELLHAIEHLGAKVCGLEPEEHDRLRMDAGRFKARRDAELLKSAEHAAIQVRRTAQPYTFPPMSSHERRRLHLALNATGLKTESIGEGSQRAVVLYPSFKKEA